MMHVTHEDLLHCFFPFIWFNLKGLQVFLRFGVSQKSPDARACWSHSSNSSSSSVISASKSQGYLLELDLWDDFSNPTMFTWKLGLCVFGLQAMPCTEEIRNTKTSSKGHISIFFIMTEYWPDIWPIPTHQISCLQHKRKHEVSPPEWQVYLQTLWRMSILWTHIKRKHDQLNYSWKEGKPLFMCS